MQSAYKLCLDSDFVKFICKSLTVI